VNKISIEVIWYLLCSKDEPVEKSDTNLAARLCSRSTGRSCGTISLNLCRTASEIFHDGKIVLGIIRPSLAGPCESAISS
jgi:hypothetical protein